MINGKRYLTVNTDASYLQAITAAGVAAWIVHDTEDGGVLRYTCSAYSPDIRDVHHAELAACYFGLLHVQRLGVTSDVIVWNTDNKSAVLAVNMQHNHPVFRQMAMMIHEIAALMAPKLYAKWVPGHTAGGTAREFVNNWCDKESRLALSKGKSQPPKELWLPWADIYEGKAIAVAQPLKTPPPAPLKQSKVYGRPALPEDRDPDIMPWD